MRHSSIQILQVVKAPEYRSEYLVKTSIWSCGLYKASKKNITRALGGGQWLESLHFISGPKLLCLQLFFVVVAARESRGCARWRVRKKERGLDLRILSAAAALLLLLSSFISWPILLAVVLERLLFTPQLQYRPTNRRLNLELPDENISAVPFSNPFQTLCHHTVCVDIPETIHAAAVPLTTFLVLSCPVFAPPPP